MTLGHGVRAEAGLRAGRAVGNRTGSPGCPLHGTLRPSPPPQQGLALCLKELGEAPSGRLGLWGEPQRP